MLNFIKRKLRSNNCARKIRDIFMGVMESQDTAARKFAQICIKNDINVVFDVGANVGQFAKDLRRHSYQRKIVSFEPVLNSFQILARNFKSDSDWIGFKLGVGSAKGFLNIQVSANAGLSTSFMDMKQEHLLHFPSSAYIRTEKVEISTLSSQILDLKVTPSELAVKIDVQGFELEVLKGMANELSEIKLLLLEVSLVQLYVEEPTLLEIIEYLELHGHEVINIYRGVKSKSGDLLQVDIISTLKIR